MASNEMTDEKASWKAYDVGKRFGLPTNQTHLIIEAYVAALPPDSMVKALEENLESMRQTNAALVKKLQAQEAPLRAFVNFIVATWHTGLTKGANKRLLVDAIHASGYRIVRGEE